MHPFPTSAEAIRTTVYASPVPTVPMTTPRAVLGLDGGPTDPLVIDLGCDLAQQEKAELIAIHVVEVDWQHDLNAEMGSSVEHASRILDLADGAAEKARVPMRTLLLQARDVGAALVDEAVALDADAVIVGLPYRKRFGGDFAMGRTILYVLKNAPCRVYVVREPVADGKSRQAAGRRD
jgi:nucleotide-binding universal stress UspA family protein